MNLAHGLGIEAMRSERPDLLLGNIYNFRPCEPAAEREEDEIASVMLDALWNRSAPDPQIRGRYPEPLAGEMEAVVEPGDLEIINQKLDYFAFTHYTVCQASHDAEHPFSARAALRSRGGRLPIADADGPDVLRQVAVEAKERYAGDLPVYILGNGVAFADIIDADGRIRDEGRIAYLRGYLGAVLDAIAAGVQVRGYFVRSLLDGFEWAHGHSRRFGLVHVDFSSFERRPKDPFYFYSELANGVPLERE